MFIHLLTGNIEFTETYKSPTIQEKIHNNTKTKRPNVLNGVNRFSILKQDFWSLDCYAKKRRTRYQCIYISFSDTLTSCSSKDVFFCVVTAIPYYLWANISVIFLLWNFPYKNKMIEFYSKSLSDTHAIFCCKKNNNKKTIYKLKYSVDANLSFNLEHNVIQILLYWFIS